MLPVGFGRAASFWLMFIQNEALRPPLLSFIKLQLLYVWDSNSGRLRDELSSLHPLVKHPQKKYIN
jgi:hypothetical protein